MNSTKKGISRSLCLALMLRRQPSKTSASSSTSLSSSPSSASASASLRLDRRWTNSEKVWRPLRGEREKERKRRGSKKVQTRLSIKLQNTAKQKYFDGNSNPRELRRFLWFLVFKSFFPPEKESLSVGFHRQHSKPLKGWKGYWVERLLWHNIFRFKWWYYFLHLISQLAGIVAHSAERSLQIREIQGSNT